MRQLIGVVTHKQCNIVSKEPYIPIIVGNNMIDIVGAYHDNTGINISKKNKNYCELTALYWIWKNCISEFDIIGLCHYRRYFTKNSLSKKSKWFLNKKDIDKYMKTNDVIMPVQFNWSISVAEIYYKWGKGKKKDLELTRDAINKLYPEYVLDFEMVVEGKRASYCNMFIMKSKFVAKYCEWLFLWLRNIYFCLLIHQQ